MTNYFDTIDQVKKYLLNKINPPIILFPKYSVSYIESTDTHKYLIIEKLKNGLFGTLINAIKYPIGSIDLEINKQKSLVEINWWMVNNEAFNKLHKGLYSPPLSSQESKQMKELLIKYAEIEALINNIKLIKRDIHNSLNEYNNDLKDFGFILTDEKADDNYYWIKIYKELN
jgi:hypothetical protein